MIKQETIDMAGKYSVSITEAIGSSDAKPEKHQNQKSPTLGAIRDEVPIKTQANAEPTLDEMFASGEFGIPLKDLGIFSLTPEAVFKEFPLDLQVEVLSSKMLEFSKVGSNPVPSRHVEKMESNLPEGEFIIFASMQRVKGIAVYSFISNRRVAFSIEEHEGVLYAKREYPLSKISNITLNSGDLLIEIESEPELNLGETTKSNFESLIRRLNGDFQNQTSPSLQQILGSLTGQARKDLERFSQGEEPKLADSTWFSGTIVAWEDRIAIIKQGILTGFVMGSKQQSNLFYLDDVSNITVETFGSLGLGGGAIQVLTASNPSIDLSKHSPSTAGVFPNVYVWNAIDSSEYRKLGSGLQEILMAHKAKQTQSKTAEPTTSKNQLAQELKQVSELFAAGVLTEEEFKKAKSKLLD
jgi:hypothetical protein